MSGTRRLSGLRYAPARRYMGRQDLWPTPPHETGTHHSCRRKPRMTQTPEEVDEAALETAITLVVTTLEARLTAVDHELSILNERADRLRNLRRQYVEKLKALRGKEAIEPPGPQVQCPICQRGFDSDQGLIVHTNRMHKKVEMAPIPAPSPLEQRRTKLM